MHLMNKRLWSVYSFFYKGSIFLYPNRTQCHLKKIPTKLIKYGLCRDLPFYSNSSLQSCYVVFFVDFSVRVQQVLSDFYLLHGFLRDFIVILLSFILTIINKKLFRKQLFWYSHTPLRRHICSKFIRNNTYIWLQQSCYSFILFEFHTFKLDNI